MIPVAAILVLLVVIFTLAMLIGNTNSAELSIFGAKISADVAGVYFTGAGTMLVLIFALGLLWTGLKRQRTRRKKIKALARAAADQKSVPQSAVTVKSPVKAPASGKTTAEEIVVTTTASTPAERRSLLDEAEQALGDEKK